MSHRFKNNSEIIDAETVKVVYETAQPASDNLTAADKNEVLADAMQVAIRLDQRLYQNRYGVNRNDANIIPKVKNKKLDDKLYRPRVKNQTSLIKDFDKHKIRSFSFAAK